MAELGKIVAALNRELNIEAFQDSSHNGLQVEGPGTVSKVCCGVDASMEFFEQAHARGADLLICHHGLSWGDSLKRITDLNYRRLSYLLEHKLALYACHLPLDAHASLGNNAGIARALKLRDCVPFGEYNGSLIGFAGRLAKGMAAERFRDFVARQLKATEVRCMPFGPERVRSVAVVSGGAAAEVAEAGRKGIDAYVSGEPSLVAYSLAQEYGVHALFAGHYATEVFGVRALAGFIRRRFRIEAEFVDFGVPF
jgi:dinuclear metal center YbgI/SA1388 family protein